MYALYQTYWVTHLTSSSLLEYWNGRRFSGSKAEYYIRLPEVVLGIYGIVHKGTRRSFGYLRICPDHSGIVPGGSGSYENGTGEVLDQPEQFLVNRWTSRKRPTNSRRASGRLDHNPDRHETYPDDSGTPVNSLGRS